MSSTRNAPLSYGAQSLGVRVGNINVAHRGRRRWQVYFHSHSTWHFARQTQVHLGAHWVLTGTIYPCQVNMFVSSTWMPRKFLMGESWMSWSSYIHEKTRLCDCYILCSCVQTFKVWHTGDIGTTKDFSEIKIKIFFPFFLWACIKCPNSVISDPLVCSRKALGYEFTEYLCRYVTGTTCAQRMGTKQAWWTNSEKYEDLEFNCEYTRKWRQRLQCTANARPLVKMMKLCTCSGIWRHRYCWLQNKMNLNTPVYLMEAQLLRIFKHNDGTVRCAVLSTLK